MIEPGSSLKLGGVIGGADCNSPDMILVAQTRIERSKTDIYSSTSEEKKGSDSDSQLFQVVDKVTNANNKPEKRKTDLGPKMSMASDDIGSNDQNVQNSLSSFNEDFIDEDSKSGDSQDEFDS